MENKALSKSGMNRYLGNLGDEKRLRIQRASNEVLWVKVQGDWDLIELDGFPPYAEAAVVNPYSQLYIRARARVLHLACEGIHKLCLVHT